MPLEKQLLPNPALAPVYDAAVWVYVYRDFSGNEADRAAERILWRFGVSSWPQLFLADPHTLKILTHTGRTTASFLDAVRRTRVEKTRSLEAADEMAAAEKRADDLERRPTVKAARKALTDEDIVVRYTSLRILAEKSPRVIAEQAVALLQVPNDPFRYEVCKVLQKSADPQAREPLEALAREPAPSLNPNVVRIRAVQALATCGNAASVEVIRPFAASGDYFNGLTGVAVDVLASIAKRHKGARKAVQAALKSSYPKPPEGGDKRAQRACVGLARRIFEALGEKRSFPKIYDEKARAALMR